MPTARPQWVQQRSHRAAEQQKLPLPLTSATKAPPPLAGIGRPCGQVDAGGEDRRDRVCCQGSRAAHDAAARCGGRQPLLGALQSPWH
eukprot:scaffold60872_cov97-Phaeocystis_antarctica.AAC.1